MDTTRASLLVQIKDKDDSAAWRVFDSIYRPMLLRFAIARGLDDGAADEIAQQCMVTIHQHIQSFEYDPKKGKFKSWLKTMVCNRVKNHFRDQRERCADTADFQREDCRALPPDELFEKVWMDEHLRYCLAEMRLELGEETYDAFYAYAIAERPVEDVCKETGLCSNQLYKLKWKITQTLKVKMKVLEGAE